MTHVLVVTTPFGDFERGQVISDPQVISVLLADHHDKVVRVVAAPVIAAKE